RDNRTCRPAARLAEDAHVSQGWPVERGIAVRVAAGDVRRAAEARALEVERAEDPTLELRPDRVPACRFDDQPEEDVARVRVRPGGSGGEQRLMRGRDPDQPRRCPDLCRLPEDARDESLVVREVEEPARVVEQLADGDRLAVRHEPGQPMLDGAVEGELSFA